MDLTLLTITYSIGIILLLLAMLIYWNGRLRGEIAQKQQALEERDILQKQQDFFIRKMVHEMNTPLSAIELNISVMMRDYPNVRNLEMIKSSARILSTIYDDIAFLSRKEFLCPVPEWINIEEFIADRILYFDAMLSVKEIVIEMEIDEGYEIHMSRTELQRLIDNNLSNAVKYTQKHGEIIIIVISKESDGLLLTFKDNGIGMSEEERQKLFEVYYRGNAHHQGLGLGMSIIKDICDANAISIRVESVKGEGSSFTYNIPETLIRQTSIKQSDAILRKIEARK
ncbi:histidine kinase [Sulfuricurvum kujiense DSM 16994]|uniref:histidine kinase n=1 Tax=Sulfuricurvum kujiense (strain ATCC BAA-921 / DSM 16994 / JCM 11577 / YK-1) TaxID=709032 RepID=E4U1A4_SULKY|nr:HAMP domain-containing sensor histidine kinase [Sulfuricurvum kujiense]ADR34441.1 histidine kinase [Sulfuricurvum kujiense DSM 16994]